MNRLIRLFSSSIGRKLVLAITGIGLFAFLIGHLAGNLMIFQGQEQINAYAAFLQGNSFTWVARAGLLICFLLHVILAIVLSRENSAARPVKYGKFRHRTTSYTARHMILSGLLVLAFVVYHLLHFTFGVVDGEIMQYTDSAGRHDVYKMVIVSFSSGPVVASYVLAMLILGAHLLHGLSSVFQTFGLHHETYLLMIKLVSLGLVAIIVLGNISIPVLIYSGAVGGE